MRHIGEGEQLLKGRSTAHSSITEGCAIDEPLFADMLRRRDLPQRPDQNPESPWQDTIVGVVQFRLVRGDFNQ